MSEANIHAAAERMREYEKQGVVLYANDGLYAGRDRDRSTLADFALGLLDEGGITRDALKELGFATNQYGIAAIDVCQGSDEERVSLIWRTCGLTYGDKYGCPVPATTVGQLRALLFALGAGGGE